MIEFLKTLLLGEKIEGAYFVRSMIIKTTRGSLTLWNKQPYTRRKKSSRKKKTGTPFWELENTITSPLFGRSKQASPEGALREILDQYGLGFTIVKDELRGGFTVSFHDDLDLTNEK